jgi:phospholipase C
LALWAGAIRARWSATAGASTLRIRCDERIVRRQDSPIAQEDQMSVVAALRSLVDHVVIIVKENHTFDNYFGTLPGVRGATLAHAQNPPPDDPGHRHEVWEQRASDTAHRVQYIEADIPQYFALARGFTLCDCFFSEVAGPSTPNHLMLICADAPIINNPRSYNPSADPQSGGRLAAPPAPYVLASLPAALEAAGLTWASYGGYAFHYVKALAGAPTNHVTEQFPVDAAAGNLPAVTWLYAEGHPPLSEHPRQDVTDGARWTADQLKAIVTGKLWNRTVVFITWDDWGGWFDHVVPPNVEQWDSSKAQHPADAFPEFNGQQFRYGSRVPCLVVGPYAKHGHVSKMTRSHISIVKFCTELFGVPPPHPRLQHADDMSDCFDPKQPPLPPPSL